MSNSNEPHDHEHPHEHRKPAAASVPAETVAVEDVGTRALQEALRSSFVIVKIIMVILVACFFGSGFFTVEPENQAIILRFGKPLGTGKGQLLEPGGHWSIPYPVDEVVKIPIKKVLTATSTVGWRAESEEEGETRDKTEHMNPQINEPLRNGVDGYTLTGDRNIIHVRAIMRYHISDPLAYELGMLNAPALVTNALNNAILFASAGFAADDALRIKVARFKEIVQARVNERITTQKLGIAIDSLDVKSVPPRQARMAFNEVINADQGKQQKILAAQGYANKTLNEAKGEYEARINAGKTDRTRMVQTIEGDATYFKNQLPYYKSNPDLFVRQRQTVALQRVMTNAQDKFFLPNRADGQPRELRLQLNREPKLDAFR